MKKVWMVSIYNAIWIVYDYIKREEMRKKREKLPKIKLLFYKVYKVYFSLLYLNSYF